MLFDRFSEVVGMNELGKRLVAYLILRVARHYAEGVVGFENRCLRTDLFDADGSLFDQKAKAISIGVTVLAISMHHQPPAASLLNGFIPRALRSSHAYAFGPLAARNKDEQSVKPDIPRMIRNRLK